MPLFPQYHKVPLINSTECSAGLGRYLGWGLLIPLQYTFLFLMSLKRKSGALNKVPAQIPAQICPPNLLFGTYKLSKESCSAAFKNVFSALPSNSASSSSSSSAATVTKGYLGVDCAPIYSNEKAVGVALKSALKTSNTARSTIWVQTKLWRSVRVKKVHTALRKSLKDLQLDYVDCVLMHWPGPGKRAVVSLNKPLETIY